MTKQEQIEEMISAMAASNNPFVDVPIEIMPKVAEALYNAGYRKLPEYSVVLSREEYEKLRSLYDCEQCSYMTSSIGDLPLTVEGLRKAVDEITRLNRVEAELQELNIKYYNEAKDLRRELKQARKETAEKYHKAMRKVIHERDYIRGYAEIGLQEENDKIAEQFEVEIKE